MTTTTRGRPEWQVAGVAAAGFVAVLWAIEVVDVAVGHRVDEWGIEPREVDGFFGILAAPLLHGGWAHLVANTVPAFVLGFLVLATGLRRGLVATAVIWGLGGLGVWLFAGDNTVHIGASGLVFGWLTYLIVQGFVDHKPGEIAVGVIVVLVYGSILWGVLPGQPGVSWQGHLFGAVAGVVAAFAVSERRGSRRR